MKCEHQRSESNPLEERCLTCSAREANEHATLDTASGEDPAYYMFFVIVIVSRVSVCIRAHQTATVILTHSVVDMYTVVRCTVLPSRVLLACLQKYKPHAPLSVGRAALLLCLLLEHVNSSAGGRQTLELACARYTAPSLPHRSASMHYYSSQPKMTA